MPKGGCVLGGDGVYLVAAGVTWWRRLSLEYVKVAVNKIMLEPLDL